MAVVLSSCKLLMGVVCFVTLLNSGEAIRCAVCESSVRDGSTDCISQPPQPTVCSPEMPYCIVVGKYNTQDQLQGFSRSCSPISLPTACKAGVDRVTAEPLQVCYSMCQKDGCNGSKSLHHLLELLRRRRRSSPYLSINK
jgi:hypothetical protein